MNGHVLRLGAALLALIAVLLVPSTTWAQDAGRGRDFCDLIDLGSLSVNVTQVEHGVVVTLSTPSEVAAVHEQAHRLADRARAGLEEGVVPPAARGDWTLVVPPASVIVSERVSGTVLIMTDSWAEGVAALKAWGAHVQQLLIEGHCTDLLAPAGQV